MSQAFIPQSYQDWHRCITVDCGLSLTPNYIDQQIQALQDNSAHYTQQFLRLYGQAHLDNVILWFQQARKSI